MSTRTDGTRAVPAATLAWLEHELDGWQAEGRIDAATARGIRAQYVAGRRFPLARGMLLLGGAFVGVGLIWLVAANLEHLSPVARFAAVVAVWLSAVLGAEVLAGRRGPGAVRAGDATVGALRLVGALAFGAVVFQAAQSLQVPAYSSGLVGLWSAGALLHAYAVAGVAPLLIGIGTGVGWYGWTSAEQTQSMSGTALALLLAAAAATAVAVVHGTAGPSRFAAPWRTAATLLALVGLFLAALPAGADEQLPTTGMVVAGAVAALLAAVAAAAVSDRLGRLEVLAGVSTAGLGWLALLWRPPGGASVADLSGAGLLRALAVIVLFLAAALWHAALGVLRDADGLTRLATAALVVFTVVQSFAIFEPLLSGAALFLALGAVLAAAGYLVDRGRRTLVATVREVEA